MGTKTVDVLNDCNICGKSESAIVDAPTTMGTSWAYMCPDCFLKHGRETQTAEFMTNRSMLRDETRIGTNYKLRTKEEKKETAEREEERQRNPPTITSRLAEETTWAETLDESELEAMVMDSVCPTACPEGCEVEPDGNCCHGYRSALLILGII